MDLIVIDSIKAKLLNFIDPYYVIKPIDKEVIIEINNYLISLNINCSLYDGYISQQSVTVTKKVALLILQNINTKSNPNIKIYQFKSLLNTSHSYPEPLYDQKIKSFIANWFCNIFNFLANNHPGAIVKFIIDKILSSQPTQFDKALKLIMQTANEDTNHNTIELADIYDIYQQRFITTSKRNLALAIELPADCEEEVYSFIQTIIQIYLSKISAYIYYDKQHYNNIYLNFYNDNNYQMNNGITKKTNTSIDAIVVTQLETTNQNVWIDQNQLLLTKIKQLKLEPIDLQYFKEFISLITNQQTIVDLQIRDQNCNLLEIATNIKHVVKDDLISAIFNKVLMQKIKDENTDLYNKYVCFTWAIQQADLVNFKKILPHCHGFELNNAEGKVLFEHISQYSEPLRYSFIKLLVDEVLNDQYNYYLSLEYLLQQSCLNNYVDLATRLLQNGAKVNSAVNGVFPVHIAAKIGSIALIQQLVTHKANVEVADQDGHTALYLAAANGHTEVSDYLLNQK